MRLASLEYVANLVARRGGRRRRPASAARGHRALRAQRDHHRPMSPPSRAALQPNEPVASDWPEFRQAGKGEIPPRWLRSGCGRAAVWLTTHIIRNIGPAATLAGPRCSGPTALRVSSRRRDVSAVRWTTARSTPSLRRRLSVRVWNGYLPQRGQG